MKIQRGFGGLLDQKEIWHSDWKRNSKFQKRLLRRSLDQKTSTLWDATPRVWAVEGFSSAVSSHKKQYLLGQSIIRSHICYVLSRVRLTEARTAFGPQQTSIIDTRDTAPSSTSRTANAITNLTIQAQLVRRSAHNWLIMSSHTTRATSAAAAAAGPDANTIVLNTQLPRSAQST
jgi:hypothetical protein